MNSALYKIKLQNFEGPLDLLLFFVRKDELNIYDIPIARITKSYLEYLQLMQGLNLDIASEFILMAATLMRIKVKMMLPKDPADEEEEEMMDPREELSRRLIEYRQFKEASKSLSELDEYWRQVYRRSYFNFDLLPQNEEEVIGLKDISFFDLLAAYKKALEKKPIPIFHNVERLNVTVEDQQKYIMAFFRDRNCYLFTELCDDMAKIEIVVTFLALLDLVKRADIAIKQASIFDDIWIYKATEFKDEGIPESERADESMQELMNPLIEEQAFGGIDSASGPVINEQADTEVEIEFRSDASQSFEVPQDHPIQQDDKDIASHEIPLAETEDIVSSDEFISADSENDEGKASEDAVIPSPVVYFNETKSDQQLSSDAVDLTVDKTEEISQSEPAALSDSKEIESREVNVISGVQDPMIKEEQQTEIEDQNKVVTDTLTDEKVKEGQETLVAEEVIFNTHEVKITEPEVAPFDETPVVLEAAKADTREAVVEPVKSEKTTIIDEKIPRWKNFLNKIVSMVRRIFSK